jgi:2-C-methyl-D-erythritol 4-phosphate cytidylyltransferase
MPKIGVIIAAAGSGKRLGYKTAKPYIKLANKALLAYCLDVFDKTAAIDQIIIAADKNQLHKAELLIKKNNYKKVAKVIRGGKTRSQSVFNGLRALNKDTDYVLIHDGARPFISKGLINRIVKAVIKHKAVICAIPCVQTIKSADKNLEVMSTLDRNILWQVQTPQAFSSKLILSAYEKQSLKNFDFFDDAQLIEKIPHKVKIVEGLNTNIKITTADDLKIAKAIIKQRIEVRD